jgi:hypothetical protein
MPTNLPPLTMTQSMIRAQTRELPGHYPFVVQGSYIKTVVKEWKDPAHKLCREVFTILSKRVKELVREHLKDFGQGQLEQRVMWVYFP